MLRRIIMLIVVCAVAIGAFVLTEASPVSAATNLGGGVMCHGTPTYGTSPRINCSRTGSRYASWVAKYSIGGGRCEYWVLYGSAWVWPGGTITKSASSSTLAYEGPC